MNNEIFEKLKSFTVKESFVSDVPLTRETIIDKDLGVTGDDAVEFIIAYGKQFNVDVSKFIAKEYFHGEGIDIFGSIIRAVTGKKNPKQKELTLGDLEKGVIAGKLDETVIEHK